MADFEAILGSTLPTWLTSAQESLLAGDVAAALKTSEEACSSCASKGDKKGEGAALIMVAKAAFQGVSFDVGSKASSKALHIFQALKDKVGEAAALLMVSTACVLMGEFREAISTAEDAAILAKSGGSQKQMAHGYAAVASAAVALLQTQENADPDVTAKALEAAQASSTVFRELEDKANLAKVLEDLSKAYLASGNSNMAIAKAKMVQRLHQENSDVSGEGRALVAVAKGLQQEGSHDAAVQHLTDAAGCFESVGDQRGLAEAYELMEVCQASTIQERTDLTNRIVGHFSQERTGPELHSWRLGGRAVFIPPTQPVELGPATVRITGFMGRAALAVAPKTVPGQAKVVEHNKFLLYNVSWN